MPLCLVFIIIAFNYEIWQGNSIIRAGFYADTNLMTEEIMVKKTQLVLEVYSDYL